MKIEETKKKIKNLLDKGVILKNKLRSTDRHPEKIHPSIIGDCIRKVYYGMTGETQEFTPTVLRIFDNGHYSHERMSDYFRQAGVLIAEELHLKNEEYDITCHVDAIIEIDGKRVCVDFKTCKDYPYKLLKSGKKGLSKTYVYQMNTYLWLLELDVGYFIYENKNTQELFIIECKKEEGIIKDVKERISLLRACVKNKVLPPKEYDINSDWQCKYCSYKDKCYCMKEKREVLDKL